MREVANAQLTKDLVYVKGRLEKMEERLRGKEEEVKALREEVRTIGSVHEKVTEKALKL